MGTAETASRRSAIEILTQMLLAYRTGAVASDSIKDLSHLRADQVARYMAFLSSHKLIEQGPEADEYSITPLGTETLREFEVVVGRLRDMQGQSTSGNIPEALAAA